MSESSSVYVVDDDPAMRDSLKWLLESVDFQVHVFESATSFLEEYGGQRPACLVLDVRMPGMSGLDLQDELVRRGITIPMIMISAHGDVPVAVRALKTGAIDFIEKPFSDQLLLDRVRQALHNDQQASETDEVKETIRARKASLTPREKEVMELVVAGNPNKSVASHLGLSQKTVEIHRARVMSKMSAGSLAELVRDCLMLK
ncbi:MAG: response regulator transcription factor [Candidatus Binatia bacterium]|nr:response regulator transcription factor [Candidatus Binatia bacterium]MDG2009279.1 response regulator transcription factor [Candidatus Binatia bacterium]HAC80778.1 DNA-binding response regulator [Deltaproteobacteria bacterium]